MVTSLHSAKLPGMYGDSLTRRCNHIRNVRDSGSNMLNYVLKADTPGNGGLSTETADFFPKG